MNPWGYVYPYYNDPWVWVALAVSILAAGIIVRWGVLDWPELDGR